MNVVFADEIQEFSVKRKLDDEGKEHEVMALSLYYNEYLRADRYKLLCLCRAFMCH